MDNTTYTFKGTYTDLLTMAGKSNTAADFVKVVNKTGTIAFKDGTASANVADGDKITTGYLQVQTSAGAADVSGIVDVSNLEADTGAAATAQHYTLPSTSIKKLAGSTGTGLKVGSGTAYVAYTGTYGNINQKDGAAADGITKINAKDQVLFTIYDDSVAGAGAKSEVAVAYNASTADLNATIDSGSKGTMMYVGDKTGTAVVDSTATAADADKTFYIGYVKATIATTIN